MPITTEFFCRECGEELEAEETNLGQIFVSLCATCKARLLLIEPPPEPEPATLEEL